MHFWREDSDPEQGRWCCTAKLCWQRVNGAACGAVVGISTGLRSSVFKFVLDTPMSCKQQHVHMMITKCRVQPSTTVHDPWNRWSATCNQAGQLQLHQRVANPQPAHPQPPVIVACVDGLEAAPLAARAALEYSSSSWKRPVQPPPVQPPPAFVQPRSAAARVVRWPWPVRRLWPAAGGPWVVAATLCSRPTVMFQAMAIRQLYKPAVVARNKPTSHHTITHALCNHTSHLTCPATSSLSQCS
jgi:hypothetical protein